MISKTSAFRVACACLLGAALLASMGVHTTLLSAEPETYELRIPPVAGEPGELVTLEFWVTGIAGPDCCSTNGFECELLLPEGIGKLVRLDREGTVAAAAPPRSAFLDLDFRGVLDGRQYPCAFAGFSVHHPVPLAPTGADGAELLLKAVFRIDPEAAPGVQTIVVQGGFFHVNALGSMGVDVSAVLAGSETSLEVLPPSGPRPVRDLTCSQVGEEVLLSWGLTEAYDSLSLSRDGVAVATLGGDATSYADRPQPGPARYEVVAARDGEGSLPADCALVVEVPRPKAVTSVRCQSEAGLVSIAWKNGEPYDAIALFRNGHLIAELAGSAESHTDPYSSRLFTVYAVQGRVGDRLTLPASASINAISNPASEDLIWMEEVPSWPGETLVPVRIFGTHTAALSGFSVACRFDPTKLRGRALSAEGSDTESAGYDYFAGSIGVDGIIYVGCVFDWTPPLEDFLPAGVNQHLMTVVTDVNASVPGGTTVVFDVGSFFGLGDSPPDKRTTFIDPDAQVIEPRMVDGAILVGEKSVPRVESAAAELIAAAAIPEGGAGGAAPPPAADSILVRWRDPVAYDSIRIEADGGPLVTLPGDSESFLHADPGPGIHEYKIYGSLGGIESFPAVVTAVPPDPPGAFIRGDADSDRAVNITDAVALLEHLFRGGEEPLCLDAADADDDGELSITDPIAILGSLFLGEGPLPAPGPEVPWFDPTEDELTCRGS